MVEARIKPEDLLLSSHTDPGNIIMRSAIIIFAVVIAAAAEAPYHLPRPAPHAPPFGYPPGPAPPPPRPPILPPAPFPQLPQLRPAPQPFAPFPHPAPAPQLYAPSQGYNYQQPSFGPAFVRPAPQPAPQPIPVYHPPTPVHLPVPQPQPLPIAYPQPVPITYPQPQPLPVSYPQPQPISIPQLSYGLPQPQPQPQPQPLPQPLPQPVPQPLPQPQLLPQPLPSFLYSVPQSGSFAYQLPVSQPQFAALLPLQTQPLTNNGLSSYQADSNQYNTAQEQVHREALDQTVVSRVQNIIRDSEHTSAKNAGYLSLVSGVSLEKAKPSIEISSFVHSSPQNEAGLIDIRSASGAVQSSSSAASVSSINAAPAISVTSGQSTESDTSFGFLPNTKPGISYGVPN